MHQLNQHEIIVAYVAGNRFGELIGISFEIKEIAAHGGLLAALMDGALGIAALSVVVDRQQIVATVEMNVKYLRPVLIGDQIVAKAEVVQAGKRLLFSEAKVFNQKEELVAIGTGTFNAYPKEKAGY